MVGASVSGANVGVVTAGQTSSGGADTEVLKEIRHGDVRKISIPKTQKQ
jgi:hypothetical protein